MDFTFSDEQQMVIDEARHFAQKELAPTVEEFDRRGEPNLAALKKLGQLGYLGMAIPEAYGGSNVGAIACAGALLEIAKEDAGTAVAMSVHNSVVSETIVLYGTDAQKSRTLPRLASGEAIGCFALTEANSGSDPGGLQMTATPDGDHYLLNGVKTFVTNGAIADVIIVFALTDKARQAKGISAFVLPKETPGVSVGKHEDKMGIRSASCTELLFDNCRLPLEARLGEENKGLKIALSVLDGGRIGITAQAVGIAMAAYQEALRHAKDRTLNGKPIADFQSLQFMLADMATEIEVARTMLFRVAWMKQSGVARFSKEVSMAKLFASEMSHRVCHKALQIHGGYGYMKDYKIERLYRDQRITEIYEGSSEIQRYIIARSVLGEPA
jgi:butyryl-CoA dehydrogenase